MFGLGSGVVALRGHFQGDAMLGGQRAGVVGTEGPT